ncbi:uncharacterized protein METZ01_LOCUS336271, partial [marine metagenome]
GRKTPLMRSSPLGFPMAISSHSKTPPCP